MSSHPLKTAPRDIYAFTEGLLREYLSEIGVAPFRAGQLLRWVHDRGVDRLSQMTDLSRADRAVLEGRLTFGSSDWVVRQNSEDGTIKLLIGWAGGASAETVLIPDGHQLDARRRGAARLTACVSSQVGCPVGCRFCASGLNGLKQNLSTAQIIEQLACLNDILRRQSRRVTHIVFMGMGEPLANYNAVMGAVRVMNDPAGLKIGARRITISTVGVPPRIRELAEEDLQINLALSLHAPDEALRRQLIPWADHFDLDDILDACRFYFEKTGREITLEYILLEDVNDQPHHARQLVRLCRTLRANVNLLRYNPVEGTPFRRPGVERSQAFLELLRAGGVKAHLRRSRGRDIDAACGQLRKKEERKLIVLN